jgi:hypothetical protein
MWLQRPMDSLPKCAPWLTEDTGTCVGILLVNFVTVYWTVLVTLIEVAPNALTCMLTVSHRVVAACTYTNSNATIGN